MKTLQSSTPVASTALLVFYRINRKSINKMSFQKVWKNYVQKDVDNVSCANIANYFKLSPERLSALLKDKSARVNFLPQVTDQYLNEDADYMFVTAEHGGPIAGFHIETFIDSCDE